MIAPQHTCEPATAEYRLDILRQEEIDRRIEDAKYLPGGHRIGGHTPAALVKPRHVGLTRAEEHALWLTDISRWQGEYQAVLDDLERVHGFIVENRDALREHAETLNDVIAKYDAMTEEYEVLKSAHARTRRAHERMEEHRQQVMPRLWGVTRAIQEALPSVPADSSSRSLSSLGARVPASG